MRTLSVIVSGIAMIASMIALMWCLYDPPRPGRHAKPRPTHKTYQLEAIDSLNVAVSCADCKTHLAVGSLTDWSKIAEVHYREKVTDGR
jgi:hypothetical protein